MGNKDRSLPATPVRVVLVSLDNHLAGVVERAEARLRRELPGLTLRLHAAADWSKPERLEEAKAEIAEADIVVATMLFQEEDVERIRPALEARRDACDAMVCAVSAQDVIRLTRMGGLSMDGSDKGPIALLKRLRGSKKSSGSGAGQMAMLRRLPKILRFVPGTAQDLRAYFLCMQCYLSGSDENVAAMVRFLIDRYADGERRALRRAAASLEPVVYPDVGVYHPDAAEPVGEDAAALPAPKRSTGTVGLVLLRSYILAEDRAHYDGVIRALEARNLRVVPVFASGLDARPAIERYFKRNGEACVDAVISLTGFSLVGGPAYNDAAAAEETLSDLGVPYLAAHPVEFQSLQTWAAGDRGLSPVEATIMVAIPELDGATGPMVYGGRADPGVPCTGCVQSCAFDERTDARRMRVCPERAAMLASRTAKIVALRRKARAERKLAVVVFNFPPNSGGVGTAAFLSVYRSVFNTLKALKADGWSVDLPADAEDLKARLMGGNAEKFGQDANVADFISASDHVAREPYLAEIEAQWGPAPGRALTNGSDIFVLGAHFGNVFVGVQPAFGYEGDPMRLLFEQGFAPTHAFSAFYRWLREDYAADAVLHFGTHGALEFMPGKQAGLSGRCWPDRLIADLPNAYLYAANNPSEGAIAKRRSAATLVSYLTPPMSDAGLYKGVADLKRTIERRRAAPPEAVEERARLAEAIFEEAAAADLRSGEAPRTEDREAEIDRLACELDELERTLIPTGLHVVGETTDEDERAAMIEAAAAFAAPDAPAAVVARVARGAAPKAAAKAEKVKLNAGTIEGLERLVKIRAALEVETELAGLLSALDGRYVRPAPGGDLVSAPEILPTGRNLHGFDPFRLPSAFALKDGARQADMLIARHRETGADLPETVALVLWGTDNLKTEGAPIAQALALMGAKPRFDSYGRLSGADLVSLEDLGRPRIDVVATLSGIFRDLLPLQTKLLAEAAWLAASSDEPDEMNFVAKHARAQMAEDGVDLERAALRVFSNADGAYGANVNQLIDAGAWENEDELADAYETRKSFAYDRHGLPAKRPGRLAATLKTVDLAYQNLDSIELGITTIDHYVDTLGGVARAVKRARGHAAPVYISDQTQGSAKVRTLEEQVALETRTRTLNPRWYEGLLKHGYEGVRQIEAHVTNTMGWSATTGAVEPWVYQQITETFVLDTALRDRLADLNPKRAQR